MINHFKNKGMIIIDTETTSVKVEEAILKWVGIYDFNTEKYEIYQYPLDEKDIKKKIAASRVIIGFNLKDYDIPVIKNNYNDDKVDRLFDYKVIVDLLEMSAAKGGKDYGQFRKNRLAQMGIKLKNFSLKAICEKLKLDDEGTKGEIDYTIFQKDKWTPEEVAEIKKYLKQDLLLTKKLFYWYESQFSPLKKFLPQKDQDNFLYLKSSLSVLAYNIICNKAGLTPEFGEKTGSHIKSFSGGHHIENKQELVKGQIYSIDVVSDYPHCVMMGNLCSPVQADEEGWDGKPFFILDGKYNNKQQGKIELALKDIFLERLKAKKDGEKEKDKSYKIVINSFYGTLGNNIFRSVYNRNSASDCTSMARTILKKAAQTLEVNGFTPLGGFTDSIYVLVPPHLTKNHMMNTINRFIEEVKSHVPFKMDTFKMDIEEEIRMMWFVAKNCYLYVTNKNEVKYKSTLLNTNTPKAVMKLFEEYMRPIIISTLDIPFTKKELETQIKLLLEKEPELAAQEYKVGKLTDYKVVTSLQYQISEIYGEGRHFLIPNKKNFGAGKKKSTKKKVGIRHCSIEEFKENKLTIDDIDLTHLLSHLKPFYVRNEKHETDKFKQKQLF